MASQKEKSLSGKFHRPTCFNCNKGQHDSGTSCDFWHPQICINFEHGNGPQGYKCEFTHREKANPANEQFKLDTDSPNTQGKNRRIHRYCCSNRFSSCGRRPSRSRNLPRIGGERLKKVRLFSQDEVRARYRERNPFLYTTQLPLKMGRTRNALLLGAWKNVPGILLGYLTSYCSNDVHLTRTKHPLFPSLYFIKTRHLVNCRVGISELGAGVVCSCSATHST